MSLLLLFFFLGEIFSSYIERNYTHIYKFDSIRKLFELPDEAEYIKLLKKLFQTPTEVMEVFKVLIFRKDAPKESIYDGSTKTLVSIFIS